MRAVLYSNDMEPITVISLNGFMQAKLRENNLLSLPVLHKPEFFVKDGAPIQWRLPMSVDITVEWIVRRGQRSMMLFVDDEESALLLRAAFLPGQQKEVRQAEAGAFREGFLKALEVFGGME